jgi:hypothetical protein
MARSGGKDVDIGAAQIRIDLAADQRLESDARGLKAQHLDIPRWAGTEQDFIELQGNPTRDVSATRPFSALV